MPASLNDKIFVAGHRGMVGSALCRALEQRGYGNVYCKIRCELDLTDANAVGDYFSEEKFDQVFLAAAQVGGIHANSTYPAEFIYNNLTIQNSVIHNAWKTGVGKLLFLGSSCIYPRDVPQPMAETALLSGYLEPTNEPYAIAKIAGIKMCEAYNRQYGTDYRSMMPTNLYGPGDNYHAQNSHVIPALLRRFHYAVENGDAQVEIWGSGSALREFLHVDDLADACLHLHEMESQEFNALLKDGVSHINVGCGKDCSIKELALLIAEVTGFKGELVWDTSKPDGTPRKLLDTGLLNASGWAPRIGLSDGLASTYEHFKRELASGVSRGV